MENRDRPSFDDVGKDISGGDERKAPAARAADDKIREDDFADEFPPELPTMKKRKKGRKKPTPLHASLKSASTSMLNNNDDCDVAKVEGSKRLEHAPPVEPMRPRGRRMVGSLERPPVSAVSNHDVVPGAFRVRSSRNRATSRTSSVPVGLYVSSRGFANEESKQEEWLLDPAGADARAPGRNLHPVEAQLVPEETMMVAEAHHVRTKWYQRRWIVVGLALFACSLVGVVIVLVVVLSRQPASAGSSSLSSTTPASIMAPPTSVPTTALPSLVQISRTPSMMPSTSYPTLSPTSWDWTLSSELRTEVVSFGYRVKLSSDGGVLAVSSPNHDGGKGRFDVYILGELVNEQQWVTPDFVSGTPQTGQNYSDFMSQGMSLSGDGFAVAVGSPGNGFGLVQVYKVDTNSLRISAKGNAVVGPASMSQFGYSVALNYDGNRLFVGAPNHTTSSTAINGLVRAYDYDSTTETWVQLGDDMSGGSGSRFGHSISTDDSGIYLVVGAPLDSTKWEKAGQVFFYQLQDDKTWLQYPANQVNGADPGSQVGTTVATNAKGLIIVTNDRDKNVEKYSNAGVAMVYGVDLATSLVGMIGYPIPGTHYNAGFGYDIDVADSGEIIIASGTNNGKKAGSVRVFLFDGSEYLSYGQELMELELGSCEWFGSGPSVTVAARQLRMAVGYECIMSNGISQSAVRVFDIFAVESR